MWANLKGMNERGSSRHFLSNAHIFESKPSNHILHTCMALWFTRCFPWWHFPGPLGTSKWEQQMTFCPALVAMSEARQFLLWKYRWFPTPQKNISREIFYDTQVARKYFWLWYHAAAEDSRPIAMNPECSQISDPKSSRKFFFFKWWGTGVSYFGSFAGWRKKINYFIRRNKGGRGRGFNTRLHTFWGDESSPHKVKWQVSHWTHPDKFL